jgi:presenilin-like A22 family membrane protease
MTRRFRIYGWVVAAVNLFSSVINMYCISALYPKPEWVIHAFFVLISFGIFGLILKDLLE